MLKNNGEGNHVLLIRTILVIVSCQYFEFDLNAMLENIRTQKPYPTAYGEPNNESASAL